VSDPVSYHPMSLTEMFRMQNINAYDYDGDIILTTNDGESIRLIHLFENEIEGRTIYGLNLGRVVPPADRPIFEGTLATIEISYAYDETTWGFESLLLRDADGASMRIKRNDASFPEPTFSQI
jgi:hypothetical protein